MFSSSVGTKILIGLTGALLVLYLLIHIAGNLVVFLGPAAFNAYAHMLERHDNLWLDTTMMLAEYFPLAVPPRIVTPPAVIGASAPS